MPQQISINFPHTHSQISIWNNWHIIKVFLDHSHVQELGVLGLGVLVLDVLEFTAPRFIALEEVAQD